MKYLFRRLAFFASVFLSLVLFLTGCVPVSQKLKVESEGSSSEINVRVGDVLPMLRIPEKEGSSFRGWKQNGTAIDVESPLLSIEPLTADYVADTEKSEGLTFSRVENGLAVTGIETTGTIESLVIPAYCDIEGEPASLPVVAIAEKAFSGRVIRSVVFPNTLLEIQKEAFADAVLPHLFLPNGLTKIESEAFRGASGFSYFDISEGISSVASDAFLEMKNTAFRSFGKRISAHDGALFDGTKLIAYPAGAAPREYIVPDYATEIGEYAFYRQTFGRLIFGKNLVKVGAHALEDAAVSELFLNRVETLDDFSLRGLSTSSLRLPETLKFCGELALEAVNARRVVFRGRASFRNCGRPDAVLYAGEECYETVTKLFPAAAVFSESCLRGESPMLDGGIVVDCPEKAASVDVDASVTEIAPFAFNVKTLTSVTFSGAPPVFGAGAFYRSPNLKLFVPNRYFSAYRAASPEWADYFIASDTSEDAAEARVGFRVDGQTEYRTVFVGEKITLPFLSVAGKTFLGWKLGGTLYQADEEVAIESDTVFVAEFKKTEFTVAFYAYDRLLSMQTVFYGEGAVAPNAPVKPSTAEYDYSFDGWDRTFDRVTEDTEIRAVFREIPRYYQVEFYAEEKLLKTDFVRYGTAAVPPSDPEKDPTAAIAYRFEGWDKDVFEVKEHLKVYAVYSEAPRRYTVIYSAEGVTLKTESVEYGKEGSPPDAPFKPSDAQYDYVFRGWDKDVSRVECELVVNALYFALPKVFQVRFFADGKLFHTENVEYGKAATAPSNPVKQSTAAADYVFIGWDKDFTLITKDTEINAVFKEVPKYYAVRFYSEGELLKEEFVRYGEAAETPAKPEKESTAAADYTFIGWDKDFTAITKETEINALFEEIPKYYAVRFYSEGKLLKEEFVRYGEAAEAPANPEKESTAAADYVFIGWDKDFTAITEDTVINALFKESPKTFVVRFFADGVLIAEEAVAYGETPRVPDAPVKRPTAEFTFVFVGWDKETVSIRESVDINAVFKSEKRSYTVSAVTKEGEEVFQKTVLYGETIGALPTEWNGKKILSYKAPSGETVGENTLVTGDAVWTVVFEEKSFDPYAYTEGLEFSYDYFRDAYCVQFYFGSSTDVVIPERYRGRDGDLAVESIASGVFAERHIDSLTLPETIKEIGSNAFLYVMGLREVVLPRSLEIIGYNAFYSETEITLIVTGDALREIAPQDAVLTLCADESLYKLYSERFSDRWDVAVTKRGEV